MDEGAEDGKAGDLSSNTTVLSGTMHAGQGFPWSQAPRVEGRHTSSQLPGPAQPFPVRVGTLTTPLLFL